MKKEAIKILGFFVVVILLASSVSAFAVSSKYWEEYPLDVYPGQTVEGVLVLQNMGGDSDLTVEGLITEGEEYVSFLSDSNTFIVPQGEKVEVKYVVSIPEEATIGDVNNVAFSFKTILSGESGEFLGFSGGVERVIPLNVVAEPKPVKTGLVWWAWLLIVIAIVALIAGILMIVKSRKRVKK